LLLPVDEYLLGERDDDSLDGDRIVLLEDEVQVGANELFQFGIMVVLDQAESGFLVE
jgi:hypothetical protein